MQPHKPHLSICRQNQEETLLQVGRPAIRLLIMDRSERECADIDREYALPRDSPSCVFTRWFRPGFACNQAALPCTLGKL